MAQDHGGVEKPVYYINRLVKGPELRYSMAENVCLSLAFTMSKFNLGHRIYLVTKINPVKYLLPRP